MNDPLGLNGVPTPVVTRAELAAPSPQIVGLHRRITGNYSADSIDSKVLLLAHLVYLTYFDLKEHTTDE
jgi:hypothetical protein